MGGLPPFIMKRCVWQLKTAVSSGFEPGVHTHG